MFLIIFQACSQPKKKRLGLSFQPENPYVKRIFSESQTTAGVLIRVRVKKKKVGNEVHRDVISTSVVGRVKQIYRFECMFIFLLYLRTEGYHYNNNNHKYLCVFSSLPL